MSETLARIAELGRNVALLGRTAVQHTADDPLLLVVQSARRLPARLRGPLARTAALGTRGTGVRSAFAHFVADRREEAAAALASAGVPRTRAGRRLAAELGVQLGTLDGIPGGLTASPPPTRARAAWLQGDVDGALALLEGHRRTRRSRDRLGSERAIMQPGFRLTAPAAPPAPRSGEGARALHVLTNSLPHTRSGYAIRSHEVLRAQQQAGIAVEAVTRIGYPVTVGLARAHHTETVDGVTYRRILPANLAPTPSRRLQQMTDQVLRVADRFAPTVLHTTTNFTNALVTEAAARATGLPWVYEVRGVLEQTWLASRPSHERTSAGASTRYRLLRAKETEMMLAADHVVTLSETLRAELRGRGVPADRISVVPNAVDASLLTFDLAPRAARTRLGIPAEGFWVGTVTSVVGYEGLETLIEAVALLRGRGLDVRGAIVGDGVARAGLEALARRLGVAGVVLFPGRVDRAQAAVWHRALDVFAVPRRDVEVCRIVTPLKPIEAMAAARPVVASNLPALAELVETPGTGIVVTPGSVSELADAIERLLGDAELRAGYGAAGRQFAAGRTWRANGAAYRDLYGHLEVTA